MPYPSEKAHRLGHVPTVNNTAVAEAFRRWEVVHSTGDISAVTASSMPVLSLPEYASAADVKSVITVDGSDSEVEATREHPTIKVGYIRVAGSLVDLDRLANLTKPRQDGTRTPFIDPIKVRQAHNEYTFDVALPGSGLVRPGMNGVDTWRSEVERFITTTKYDADSDMTLADALLTIHGAPGKPATEITLSSKCPSCSASKSLTGAAPIVSKNGGRCPACGATLYLSDVLRSYEEYTPEGSNISPLSRVMLMAEKLMTFGYLGHLAATGDAASLLRSVLFITDGPLALHGVVAPLKRRLHEYLQALYFTHNDAAPLMVGVEKTGRFVEHAELIRESIPKGSVMLLSRDYINRMTGHPDGHQYGKDDFYGRRFIYRTSSGDPLVITVPPKHGVDSYTGQDCEEFGSYPTLRTVCEVLDGIRTRLYPNAVIPVALAHSAAALPLGVGQSVLRTLTQRHLGVQYNSQVKYRNPYS